MPSSLEHWIRKASDEAAFVLQAHGFNVGQYDSCNYTQVQRHLQPAYQDTMSTPLARLHPHKDIFSCLQHGNMTLGNLGCDELLVYGSLSHGDKEETVRHVERQAYEEEVPEEERSRIDRLLGRRPRRTKYRGVERTETVSCHIPGLHEVTTLTEEPQDIGMIAYIFRHAGMDDSRRQANPIWCYLLSKKETGRDLMRFCRDNPGQVHDLFKGIAGDFERKASVFQTDLDGTIGGIGISKLPDALYRRELDFKLSYR